MKATMTDNEKFQWLKYKVNCLNHAAKDTNVSAEIIRLIDTGALYLEITTPDGCSQSDDYNYEQALSAINELIEEAQL